MLVLAIKPILLTMKTVLDLPMSKNIILKLLRRDHVWTKTADKITSFQRRCLPFATNLLVQTNQRPIVRHSQLFTDILRRPTKFLHALSIKPLLMFPAAASSKSSVVPLPYQSLQPVSSVVLAVPFVKPEGKFVQISGKVLQTERVVNAVNSSFQHRPDAFYPVNVRHPVHELLCRVINHLMLILGIKPIVSGGFVGTNYRTEKHICLDYAL